MTETKTNLFVWQTAPRAWMVRHPASGMGAVGESRDEVLRLFNAVWAERAPFTVIDSAPPLPRRPEAAPQEDKLSDVEGDSRFRRALLSHFHSDHHHGKRKTFSCDEIVAVINKLWAEA